MRQGLKAFLLSAFVFPGLGQLYNQDRHKGVALVLGTNLLLGVTLAGMMVLFSQEYLAVVLSLRPHRLGNLLVKLLGSRTRPVLDPLRPAYGPVGFCHGRRGPGGRRPGADKNRRRHDFSGPFPETCNGDEYPRPWVLPCSLIDLRVRWAF